MNLIRHRFSAGLTEMEMNMIRLEPGTPVTDYPRMEITAESISS